MKRLDGRSTHALLSKPLEAFVRHARSRLDEAVRPWWVGDLGATPLDDLPPHDLDAELGTIAMRTLVLDLNVARLRGTLHGATGPERFASFSRDLARPELQRQWLARYPVLEGLLVHRAEGGPTPSPSCSVISSRIERRWAASSSPVGRRDDSARSARPRATSIAAAGPSAS